MAMTQLGAIQPEKAIEIKLKHQGANLHSSYAQACHARLESCIRSQAPYSAYVSMFRFSATQASSIDHRVKGVKNLQAKNKLKQPEMTRTAVRGWSVFGF